MVVLHLIRAQSLILPNLDIPDVTNKALVEVGLGNGHWIVVGARLAFVGLLHGDKRTIDIELEVSLFLVHHAQLSPCVQGHLGCALGTRGWRDTIDLCKRIALTADPKPKVAVVGITLANNAGPVPM